MLELKVGVRDGGILRRQVHLLYRCVRALTVRCGSVGSFGRSAFLHEGKIGTRSKCVFHLVGEKHVVLPSAPLMSHGPCVVRVVAREEKKSR